MFMEYYSDIKRNKVLTHTIIQMKSENMLNGIRQSRKDK